nr:reverse transcriptase domain-containing protein [Tanacetum cinerariifolium]
MGTRSSTRNLFSPLDNPELTIQKRSRTDPTLLNNFEMAAEGNGDLPVPDLRTMKELCQPSLNGRGGPIAPIAIQATNFRLKNDMIQQVQNSCQFHGLPEAFLNDDPSLPPPNQGNYLPQVRKELKICEAKINKSSIDEPPKVELKDLPPHLEYTFLEGDDKFPVIIAKI